MLAWLAAVAGLAASGAAQSSETQPTETKRVLIITGEDYAGHHWRETTPVLEAAIGADSRLEVEVFDELQALSKKDLAPYAAVVLHFKNYDPTVPGREGFESLSGFVEGGGGLVLVHFACGAFEDLQEDYEKLVGRVWFGAQPPARAANLQEKAPSARRAEA